MKLLLAFLALIAVNTIALKAQDNSLEWKLPTTKMNSVEDKHTGLSFYTLDQGVRAAFKKIENTTGAVVILPGPSLSVEERRKIASGGIDPGRMLTAMAVALVLSMPAEAADFFVAKEDWKGHAVYRWKTKNGAEACASAIPLQPHSDIHDVIYVGSCALKPKDGASIITRNGENALKGYEDYIPRTMREVIKAHSDPQVLSKNEGSMILTGDTFSSRVRVTYTGSLRKVTAAKKQHLDMLVTSFNVNQSVIDQYDNEMLFMEGSDEHWLPVPKKLIPFLEKEVRKGEEIIIYTEWVGAKKINNKWEWVFMVHEFQKP